MSMVAVIPARWASTRLPGKPLVDLCGKPMIQRVYERVAQATCFDRVLVATDDARIRDVVAGFDGEVVMTTVDHPTGTDRIAEAVAGLACDVVVNVQGDEPFVELATLEALVNEMTQGPWEMGTAATPIEDASQVTDPNVVKVVVDGDGGALYFSRSAIPFQRDSGGAPPTYLRHIGLYAYRRSFLERFVAAEPSALEQTEQLEQLRALHIGARIKVIEVDEPGMGIDTSEDVARAIAYIEETGL